MLTPDPNVINPAEGSVLTSSLIVKRAVLGLTLVFLVPMASFFESMKQLSYLSIVALCSILSALAYLLLTDMQLIY
jgi:bacteriorhodopsin